MNIKNMATKSGSQRNITIASLM